MLFFENHDFQAQMVDIRHLADLRDTIDSLYRQKLFDAEFYEERLRGFQNLSCDTLPNARSLIVVAYKDPPVRFSFARDGKSIQLLVPPTYLFAERKVQEMILFFTKLHELKGHHIAQAFLPKKLLAVCSGLAEYGKNNITYVKGFGSYHRLGTFFSDIVCEQGDWREPVMMERCKFCKACSLICPTGAISAERFLLHAERCMTYFDEKPADIPFPGWVKKEWHDCLVGCMQCQSICPENQDVKDWIEDGNEFSEEETGVLISGKKLEEIPESLKKKLADCDLLDMLDSFPRNLGVFFE